jgi:uncharacterized protein YdeI (YjbR/CyaY-like superfamily)
MKRYTINIPDELKSKLDSMPQINWSEVAKIGINSKIQKLERFERLENKGDI